MPLVRLLLSIFILAGILSAQRADTIFAAPLSNITSAPAYSGAIRNIGQSGHLIWVQLSDNPSCTAPADVNIGLEASFNGTNWSPVGTTISTVPVDINGNLIASATAQGSFPYIRAAVRALQAGCKADVRYSGTVGGQGTIAIEGGTGGGVIFPLYIQPSPTVVRANYFASPMGCVTLLNVSGEKGKLVRVDVTIDAVDLPSMQNGHSLFLDYNVDGMGNIPLVSLLYGVIEQYPRWTEPFRIKEGLVQASEGQRTSISTNIDYTNTFQLRICPYPNPTPFPFNVELSFSITRNVRID